MVSFTRKIAPPHVVSCTTCHFALKSQYRPTECFYWQEQGSHKAYQPVHGLVNRSPNDVGVPDCKSERAHGACGPDALNWRYTDEPVLGWLLLFPIEWLVYLWNRKKIAGKLPKIGG